MHQFTAKLEHGKIGEADLDDYFGRWHVIKQVSRTWERMGVDRFWTCRTTKCVWPVEYKTDPTAADTENAFVETVSVDRAGKPGWAYRSFCQLLVYYVPPTGMAYVCHMSLVKDCVPRWAEEYPKGRAANEGYHTHGILVPLAVFVEATGGREHCLWDAPLTGPATRFQVSDNEIPM